MNNKIDYPFYAGNEFADLMKHDGGLLHAVGASNYQVTRANRSMPEFAGGTENTYNHGPMLTYWRNKFYLEYLSNPINEHMDGGCSFLVMSEDGINWEPPKLAFPVITVPAGSYKCSDGTLIEVPQDKEGFMHQRMGFYHTKDDRLLVSGFYGHAPHYSICPWVNYGIGRVVREVYEDGGMGEIYFIRYLDYSGWTEEKLPFPMYTKCPDKSFVAACEELLSNRLVTQQWREEHGHKDETIGFKLFEDAKDSASEPNTPYEKASSFCWYHLDKDNIIGFWKQGVVGYSRDGGKTWSIKYEPSFVTSGAKAWGQKTPDGKYTVSYINSLSSEHRYPLVTLSSEDGIRFDEMACVFGELPPRRYKGQYKDFGPQYIRGICEGHKEYPDALWLCHSVNKEDIFVTRVPVPVKRQVEEHIDDNFDGCTNSYVTNWNIYSTKWASAGAVKLHNGASALRLADKDPCDYARAMRIFPRSKKVDISFDFMCAESYEEKLEVELCDKSGIIACRVLIGNEKILVRYGSEYEKAFHLPVHAAWHNLKINADCPNNIYKIWLDGEEFVYTGPKRFVNKVNDVERLIIRTKARRYLPNYEIFPDTPDMENVDLPVHERIYFITNVKSATE